MESYVLLVWCSIVCYTACAMAKRVLTEEQKAAQRERYKRWAAKPENQEKLRLKRIEKAEENAERSRKWHRENRDRAIASSRRSYQENKEARYKASRAWIESHSDEYRSYLTAYAAENSAKAVERVRQWRKANPDKVKLAHAKRKALKLGSQVGPIDFEAIKAKGLFCGICQYLIEGDYQYDHIIPLSRGGKHIAENIQLAHKSCNLRKRNRLQEELELKKTPEGLVLAS